MLAFFGFFFALGYGARLLAPLLARSAAWPAGIAADSRTQEHVPVDHQRRAPSVNCDRERDE